MSAEQKIRDILADEFRGKAIRSLAPEFFDLLDLMLADIMHERALAEKTRYARQDQLDAMRYEQQKYLADKVMAMEQAKAQAQASIRVQDSTMDERMQRLIRSIHSFGKL